MSGHFKAKDEVLQVNSEVREQQIEHEMRSLEQKKVIRLQALISKQAAKVNKDLAWKKKLDDANKNYGMRKQTEEAQTQLKHNKLVKMEEEEARLVASLKLTTQRQRTAFNNLDKVVDDGYKYYLQSYAEKRSI